MSQVRARVAVLAVYACALLLGPALQMPSPLGKLLDLATREARSVPRPPAVRDSGSQVFVPRAGGIPRAGCLPTDVIRGARIVGVGAYEGGRPTDLAFEGDGDAVGGIGLSAEPKGEPLLLVLAGHEPIIWDFASFPTQRLRAVIVFGREPQGVAGLPEDVPLRFAVDPQHLAPCGNADPAYKPGADLDRLQSVIKSSLGVGFSSFQGPYDPLAVHVEGGSLAKNTARDLRAGEIRASAPLQRSGLHAGKRGLQQLVNAGAIRPATPADLTRFGREATYSDAYVVRRATAIPRDMYGANSATFLVPDDVPMPSDSGSHNAYVREDGGYSGPAC